MDRRKRALKLGERLVVKDNIDCVALTSPPSLRYFFNYRGESFERFCCGLFSKDGSKSALIVPRLDRAKAEKSTADMVSTWTDSEGYSGAFTSAVKDLGVGTKIVGAELSITMAQMDSFRSTLGTSNFVGITEEISGLRMIKGAEEIESIRKTARILSSAFRNVKESLRPGKQESEVALEIRKFLANHGAKEVDFCAVQSGKNSAIPHAQASRKEMEKGDMVVLDISCTNGEGYFADFTRTFVIGKASERQKQVYSMVKEAQYAGCKAAMAGSSVQDVDRAARSVIRNAGYGDYFFHRTGHGLGLEVHEPPWIMEGNEQELERGMVFTVEPGIYLPGRFGVRIEDNLIVGKRMATNITLLSHELIET